MAISVRELWSWAIAQQGSGDVYIDEGGLALRCGEAYIEIGGAPRGENAFTNYYVHCKTQWNDNWSCQCNDHCPVCDHEIEPYASLDNEGTGSPEDTTHHVSINFIPEGGWPKGVTRATELEGW